MSKLWFVFFVAISVSGCGTEATDTAKVCTQSDLIAQCPAGSTPQLEASATSQCSGKVDGSVIEESGSATGSCAGTGDCTVLCQFSTPCNCGVALLTKDEVQCVTPCDRLAVCGNSACESGESIQNCPADCGAGVCIARETRCNGDIKQVCNQVGGWDDLACPTDTFCRGEGVCVDPNCVPACDGKSCGSNDGCGYPCPDETGVCSADAMCVNGECVIEVEPACTPDSTSPCVCIDGGNGSQTCSASETWGGCACQAIPTGAFLEVSAIEVTNDTNGNGFCESGESCSLTVTITNNGDTTAVQTLCGISTADDVWVSICYFGGTDCSRTTEPAGCMCYNRNYASRTVGAGNSTEFYTELQFPPGGATPVTFDLYCDDITGKSWTDTFAVGIP